jgi:hypothetical protein
VIVFSEQASDSKPSTAKVLDVEVQVLGALQSAPMGNFQFYLPEL